MTRLAHVGIHRSRNRNAGDTLLFDEVRRTLATGIDPLGWEQVQLWDPLDTDRVDELNRSTSGVVVGGGGLLLRDQAGSDTSASGWQWNVPIPSLQRLEVPLAIFAIGYNRFRGQPDFDPVFTDHLTAVVEQSSFFGLRNSGSISAVRRYLPDHLHHRLTLQPCPTTCLWQLHPELHGSLVAHRAADRRILRLNVAFDRPEHRFGDDVERSLASIARAMRHATQQGWDLRVTPHKDLDLQVLPALDRSGVAYEVDDLTDADPARILATYAQSDLVVGLRGHAQMIPFGLRVPIVSVVSHDKMQWFLDDVGHPEWGVEVTAPDLTQRLVDQIDAVAGDRDARIQQIAVSQDRLWSITTDNVRRIASHVADARPAAIVGGGAA